MWNYDKYMKWDNDKEMQTAYGDNQRNLNIEDEKFDLNNLSSQQELYKADSRNQSKWNIGKDPINMKRELKSEQEIRRIFKNIDLRNRTYKSKLNFATRWKKEQISSNTNETINEYISTYENPDFKRTSIGMNPLRITPLRTKETRSNSNISSLNYEKELLFSSTSYERTMR